jgi:hypothetical protein
MEETAAQVIADASEARDDEPVGEVVDDRPYVRQASLRSMPCIGSRGARYQPGAYDLPLEPMQ